MADVREIPPGRTELAGPALLVLRPQFAGVAELVRTIDERLRPTGYRLVGVFDDSGAHAAAVAGFRVRDALAWGRHLYVDDVSTVPASRSRGHGDLLMRWLIDEAGRLDCSSLHLDSGVTTNRAAAHRLYMRHHLGISAHHFELPL